MLGGGGGANRGGKSATSTPHDGCWGANRGGKSATSTPHDGCWGAVHVRMPWVLGFEVQTHWV